MPLLRDGLENQEVDLYGQSRPAWGFLFCRASKDHCIPSRRVVRHGDDERLGKRNKIDHFDLEREKEKVVSG